MNQEELKFSWNLHNPSSVAPTTHKTTQYIHRKTWEERRRVQEIKGKNRERGKKRLADEGEEDKTLLDHIVGFLLLQPKINPFNMPGNLVLNANHIVHSIVLIMSRLGGFTIQGAAAQYHSKWSTKIGILRLSIGLYTGEERMMS